MLTYGLLVFGILNRWVLDSMDDKTRNSLPALLFLIPLNLAAGVAFIGCLIYYIKHLYKFNNRVPKPLRIFWLLLLLLGNVLAMPVYWYLYVASEPVPHPSSS